jgi:FXSXX-COOH protein
MSERMSSHDGPLISDLLNAEEMDPSDLDALPRTLLRQSLRRLLDETGEPRGHFLWFPNQTSDPGVAPAPGARRAETDRMERVDMTGERRPDGRKPR